MVCSWRRDWFCWQTLEQVAGKRKKLLTDMAAQMGAEVRKRRIFKKNI